MKWKLAGLAFALSSTLSYGVPSMYSDEFPVLDLINDTNSTLIRDNESENLLWVLPPTAGVASLAGFSPSSNVSLCSGLKSLTSASNAIAKRVESLTARYDELFLELKEIEDLIVEANKQKAELKASSSSSQMFNLYEQLSSLKSERIELLSDMDSCTAETLCRDLQAEYQLLRERIMELEDEYYELAEQDRDLDRKLRSIDQKLSALDEAFMNKGRSVDEYFEKITSLELKISSLYASRGQLEGGFANISYDTGWYQNIVKLEEKFPSYEFRAIPTRNARIRANFIGAADALSYYASLPALLDYSIQGHKFVPYGNSDIGDSSSALPETISGNLRLSLIGACPLADESFFDDAPIKTDNAGDPLFAISATYEYPSAFKYKVSASYNLYKFYEIIRESGRKGGFFSSKSYSELEENRIDDDTFSIDWQQQEQVFTAEEKRAITADLKTELMNRVLSTMAQPVSENTPVLPLKSPGVAPSSGSIVVARGLAKGCGFNYYCQAGSWILYGANAVWGSSSSEESFKSTWNRTSTETWSSTDVRYLPATTSFGFK